MSCRKFEAPRHGSLAFCPKRRAKTVRQSIRAFENDISSDPVHLTAFYVYKAGMTHVIRSKLIQEKKATIKEILEAVTVVEAPPMVIFGVKGYKNSSNGLKLHKTVLSSQLTEGVLRRFNKRFVEGGRKPFTSTLQTSDWQTDIQQFTDCDVIRVLMYTQIEKISCLRTKRAHVAEIQVNGGEIQDKLDWILERVNKEIVISDVFDEKDLVDTIGVTKGKGFQGVTKRFGTRILPRKTNKGCRKVACIGAWHPANVLYTVPRAGQLGFHRRTEYNKMIYKIANGKDDIKTEYDLTSKQITPMGGFPHYGIVKNDFLLLKGCVVGPLKRVIALRKNLSKKTSKEEINIKFIDTSSKIGNGRFQTSEEKNNFYGVMKKAI